MKHGTEDGMKYVLDELSEPVSRLAEAAAS
jgi:hypothetical protein